MAVVATVGTTSTTSIDPVPVIADICARRALWLHVDAAYGGAAAILPSHAGVLAGADRADSVVVNPHKWLLVPFDLSALFCRRMDLLRSTFALTPEYLRTPEGGAVRNLRDTGVALGRRFRALKLWFVLRVTASAGCARSSRGTWSLRASWPAGSTSTASSSASRRCPSASCVSDGTRRAPTVRRGALNRLNQAVIDSSITVARCSCRTPACAAAFHCELPSVISIPPSGTCAAPGNC